MGKDKDKDDPQTKSKSPQDLLDELNSKLEIASTIKNTVLDIAIDIGSEYVINMIPASRFTGKLAQNVVRLSKDKIKQAAHEATAFKKGPELIVDKQFPAIIEAMQLPFDAAQKLSIDISKLQGVADKPSAIPLRKYDPISVNDSVLKNLQRLGLENSEALKVLNTAVEKQSYDIAVVNHHMEEVVSWLNADKNTKQAQQEFQNICSSLDFCVQVGVTTGSKLLQQTAVASKAIHVGFTAVSQFSSLSANISAGAIAGPVGMLGGAALSLFSLFIGGGGPNATELIINQINKLGEEITKVIGDYFKINFKNQEILLNTIVEGFQSLSKQLKDKITGARIELSSAIELVQQSINFLIKYISINNQDGFLKDFDEVCANADNWLSGYEDGTAEKRISKISNQLANWSATHASNEVLSGATFWKAWIVKKENYILKAFIELSSCEEIYNSFIAFLANYAQAVSIEHAKRQKKPIVFWDIAKLVNPAIWYKAVSKYLELKLVFPQYDNDLKGLQLKQLIARGEQAQNLLINIEKDRNLWDGLLANYYQTLEDIKKCIIELANHTIATNIKAKDSRDTVNLDIFKKPDEQLDLFKTKKPLQFPEVFNIACMALNSPACNIKHPSQAISSQPPVYHAWFAGQLNTSLILNALINDKNKIFLYFLLLQYFLGGEFSIEQTWYSLIDINTNAFPVIKDAYSQHPNIAIDNMQWNLKLEIKFQKSKQFVTLEFQGRYHDIPGNIIFKSIEGFRNNWNNPFFNAKVNTYLGHSLERTSILNEINQVYFQHRKTIAELLLTKKADGEAQLYIEQYKELLDKLDLSIAFIRIYAQFIGKDIKTPCAPSFLDSTAIENDLKEYCKHSSPGDGQDVFMPHLQEALNSQNKIDYDKSIKTLPMLNLSSRHPKKLLQSGLANLEMYARIKYLADPTFEEVTNKKLINGRVLYVFRLSCQRVNCVHLAGTFNDWLNPNKGSIEDKHDSWKMAKKEKDIWEISVLLPPGIHEFKYVINLGEEWRNHDNNDPCISINESGNSVLNTELIVPTSKADDEPQASKQQTSRRLMFLNTPSASHSNTMMRSPGNPSPKQGTADTTIDNACKNGNLALLNTVLTPKLFVNLNNQNGQTFLSTTLEHKQKGTLNYLLLRGFSHASIYSQEQLDKKLNALLKQADFSYEEFEYYLLKKANVNFIDETGSNPLHHAAKGNHVLAIMRLVECGADIHSTNSEGQTSLHIAMLSQAFDAALILLKLNANPNIEDNNKTSPFDILSASGLENLFHQYCEKFQIEPFQEKASTSSLHLTRKS